MSFKLIGSAFFISAMAFACGGGDGGGPDPDTQLNDLTAGEIQDLCETEARPVRTINCSGTTFTLGGDTPADIQDCVDSITEDQTMFPNCAATVGDAQACNDAIFGLSDADFCNAQSLPPPCEPLATPECGGQ